LQIKVLKQGGNKWVNGTIKMREVAQDKKKERIISIQRAHNEAIKEGFSAF
jgi:hypothetical protein